MTFYTLLLTKICFVPWIMLWMRMKCLKMDFLVQWFYFLLCRINPKLEKIILLGIFTCMSTCFLFAFCSNSDDNLLKNIELFDKLSLRFHGRVMFIKDVIGSNEICCWSFFGHGAKIAEVCCTSIVYGTDKKHTKVSAGTKQILHVGQLDQSRDL